MLRKVLQINNVFKTSDLLEIAAFQIWKQTGSSELVKLVLTGELLPPYIDLNQL